MPTLHRDGPWRVYIFSNEPDEPPHVHVDRDDATGKFWLEDLSVASNHGFPPAELTRIRRMLVPVRYFLLEAWHDRFEA